MVERLRIMLALNFCNVTESLWKNVAMWILFFLRGKKFRIISALVMGVAVCGMHCTVHSANLRAWQPFDWNTQTKGNQW
jgi:NO-binding membrane sensor protein with MHYT domain